MTKQAVFAKRGRIHHICPLHLVHKRSNAFRVLVCAVDMLYERAMELRCSGVHLFRYTVATLRKQDEGNQKKTATKHAAAWFIGW